MIRQTITALFLGIAICVVSCGCEEKPVQAGHRQQEYDKKIREKWGKSLSELPPVRLVIISPHNQSIIREFSTAFRLYHALEFGQVAELEWYNEGPGSNTILEYLRNTYQHRDTCGGDVLWGGGDLLFQALAADGILVPMKIPEDAKANIDRTFGGIAMYDQDTRWCGVAMSGFGFLYDAELLDRIDVAPPTTWDDLGSGAYWNQLAAADPMQSGSASAAFEMIVQSSGNWQEGWAKLLAVLGNTRNFYHDSSLAADAPISREPLSICIDFFGGARVALYPDRLRYVSPKGQTAFNPDPIGILRGAPHPELAQRFVDFVLSREGQALLALEQGHPNGPQYETIGRQPIRKDVYTTFAEEMASSVVNPYAEGNSLELDLDIRQKRFGVLRNLVYAAAVDNHELLLAARRKMVDRRMPDDLVAMFNELPENVRTEEQIRTLSETIENDEARTEIVDGWREFFRAKYEAILAK